MNAWMCRHISKGSGRKGSFLASLPVTQLVVRVYADDTMKFKYTMDILPQWIALFPRLEVLVVHIMMEYLDQYAVEYYFEEDDGYLIRNFVGALGKAARTVKRITVNSKECAVDR
jgi:hypothetical protein